MHLTHQCVPFRDITVREALFRISFSRASFPQNRSSSAILASSASVSELCFAFHSYQVAAVLGELDLSRGPVFGGHSNWDDHTPNSPPNPLIFAGTEGDRDIWTGVTEF